MVSRGVARAFGVLAALSKKHRLSKWECVEVELSNRNETHNDLPQLLHHHLHEHARDP